MSVNIVDQLKFWSNLGDRQHWRAGCKGIELINNQIDDSKSYLNRFWSHLSGFVYGENSLALVISQMTAALSMLSEKDYERLDPALLKALLTKVTVKANQYHQKHWKVYHLFMGAIQRDVKYSCDELNRKIQVISLVAQNAIDAEALRKTRVPTDSTADLAPLLKDHRFISLTDTWEKKRTLCIYIHLLPLVRLRRLGATLTDLVEVLATRTFYRYGDAAVELISRKTGWTLEKNLAEIILLASDCDLTCYSYHGTNLHALDNILANGLGSATRDYDPKIICDQQRSGSDSTSFYVAEDADRSYDYALRSPEWAYMALKYPGASLKEQEEAKKYQAFTEVALIQILRAPEEKLSWLSSIHAIAGRLQFPSESNNYSVIFQFPVATNINERVQGSTFRPLKLVYYRLPKLADT